MLGIWRKSLVSRVGSRFEMFWKENKDKTPRIQYASVSTSCPKPRPFVQRNITHLMHQEFQDIPFLIWFSFHIILPLIRPRSLAGWHRQIDTYKALLGVADLLSKDTSRTVHTLLTEGIPKIRPWTSVRNVQGVGLGMVFGWRCFGGLVDWGYEEI